MAEAPKPKLAIGLGQAWGKNVIKISFITLLPAGLVLFLIAGGGWDFRSIAAKILLF